METMSLLEACRVCANFYVSLSDMDFVHLFKPLPELQSEINFIRAELEAWQLQIMPDDGLPQRICGNCFATFCNINAIRQECITAQTRLLEAILSETTSVQGQTSEELQAVDPELSEQLIDPQNGDICLAATQMDTSMPFQTQNSSEIELEPGMEQSFSHVHYSWQLQPTLDTSKSNSLTATENHETDSFQTQDLEDMLESSIIPKNFNNSNNIKQELKAELLEKETDSCSDDESEDYDNSEGKSANDFTCQYCYSTQMAIPFADYETLSQHFFAEHDPKEPYSCPHCSCTFSRKKLRDEHLRAQHALGSEVEIAEHNITGDMKAADPIAITTATITASSSKSTSPSTTPARVVEAPPLTTTKETIQCIHCNRSIRGSKDLHELCCTHLDDWHCNICNLAFPQTPLHRFRTHQRTHEPNKQLQCRHCSRSFVRPTNLAYHEQQHFQETNLTNFVCSTCKSEFCNEYHLNHHKCTKPIEIWCKPCNKVFVSTPFLQRHQHQFHPAKDNKCVSCGTRFASAQKLRNHLSRPRDENGQCSHAALIKKRKGVSFKRAYVCSHCNKRFQYKAQLEKHLRLHDARLRPFPCEQCKVCCRNQTELQQHIQLAHKSAHGFKCTFCEYSFIDNQTLQDHLVTHKC